jgi:hypothetical protein
MLYEPNLIHMATEEQGQHGTSKYLKQQHNFMFLNRE